MQPHSYAMCSMKAQRQAACNHATVCSMQPQTMPNMKQPKWPASTEVPLSYLSLHGMNDRAILRRWSDKDEQGDQKSGMERNRMGWCTFIMSSMPTDMYKWQIRAHRGLHQL